MSTAKMGQEIIGKIAQKIAETTLHAAVFSFVSKKVSNYMEKSEKKDEKVRVDTPTDSDPIPKVG